MKNKRLKLIIFLVVLVALGGAMLFTSRRATVAQLADADVGVVLVVGESEDRFEQWSFRLCWRKKNGPWMEYLLDRQVAFWDKVELGRTTNTVTVKRDNKVIGALNTVDGSFVNSIVNRLEVEPQVIVSSEDPFDKTKRIWPGQGKWDSIWPVVALGNLKDRKSQGSKFSGDAEPER